LNARSTRPVEPRRFLPAPVASCYNLRLALDTSPATLTLVG